MPHITEKNRASIVRKLLTWYQEKKRSLPWRDTTNPYFIWISEIMLQQTQVETVIPYYERFIKAFPDVGTLAQASLQDVLKLWENMGYYSRARNLHRAAAEIVHTFNGQMPTTYEDLKSLPGIGTYTAGAILSIAFGQAVPAVDGNVRRILSRLFCIQEPVNQPGVQQDLQQMAASIVPWKKPGDFNQALMDLGATICKSREILCSDCPLNGCCLAYARGLQGCLPVTEKRSAPSHRQALAAVIRNQEGLILVVQRPMTGLLGSLWAFPGGFTNEVNNYGPFLVNVIKEDLNLQIQVGPHIASVNHAYTHFRLTLHTYEASLADGTPESAVYQNWRWVSLKELEALPLSKVDRMIFEEILSKRIF